MSEQPEVLELLLTAHYDLEPPVGIFDLGKAGINNQIAGVHTGAGDFVAKTYTSYVDIASLEYEHALLAWLYSTGLSFRLPLPLPARDGRRLCRGPRGWTALMPLLSGTCPEFRLVDGKRDPHVLEHAEAMGLALGELQVALQSYPMQSRPGRSLFGALFDFPPPARDPVALSPEQLGLPDAAAHAEAFGWWRREAAELRAFVEGPYRELPWQVCHNDFAPANLLIEHGRISAVLDFEFATLAPRALDVAMGLRMVMQVWDNPEPLELTRRFYRGYARSIRMTRAEILTLPTLIRLRAAIPVLWCLGRSGVSDDLERAPSRIENVRKTALWLDKYTGQLLDVIMQEVG